MFQITSHSVVQFSALIIYVFLAFILLFSGKSRLKRLFLLFIFTSAAWSLASLIANRQISYEPLLLLKILVLLFATWSIVAYAHFATAFVQRDTELVVKLGYSWLAFVLVLAGFSYATKLFPPLDNPTIQNYSSQLVSLLPLSNGLIAGTLVLILIRSLKFTTDSEERNRIAYLLVGLVFMTVVGITWHFISGHNYAWEHIGHAGNAILIVYTLLKYRLLDIQLVIRKWLVYTSITVCVTLVFFALLLISGNLLRLLPPQLGIPASVGLVILFACSFNWLKSALDKGADKLFYGKRYAYRQMLLDFARNMSNFIDMKEIADALLPLLTKALATKQVCLLFMNNAHYTTRFVARMTEGEPTVPLKVPEDSCLIRCLEKEGRPLSLEGLDTRPEFKGLSLEDRNDIKRAQIELLCPILRKQRLIGILALGRKHPHGYYSRDEVDFAAMLANEAALAIDNAQIYASAKEKADTDELTGLHNHRHFHQRLNEEIERCSGSDGFFSVLFMDLDFFKTYNDIYGHFLGDEILREIGQLIKDSTREIDVAARYGGDEFAFVLTQMSHDEAKAAAERIRRRLEVAMNLKSIALTCSIGVAGWLTDGVTNQQILESADNALLSAKRAGGNRVCLAHETKASLSGRPEIVLKHDNDSAIASIVYTLAATVDARDHYTYGHSMKVSEYATEIAQAMGYKRDGVERIRAAALLHDIGKLNLPDRLFTKTEPLSDEDWKAIRHHPVLGANILRHIVGLRGCLDAVLFHHEHYDGKGYPRGLSGKNIPLDARIMAVADAYDAMTSNRHYKKVKLTEEETMIELQRCAGTQFDPDIIALFISLRKPSLVPSPKSGELRETLHALSF